MSTSAPGVNRFLVATIDAVRRAGALQLARRGRSLRTTLKIGTDIVTEADLEVEAMFRAMIAERFPEHGVLAEEMGEIPASGRQQDTAPPSGPRYRWLF